MISGQAMQNIAQLTRFLEDKELKKYMVEHWSLLREKDDKWATRLINALTKEDKEKVEKLMEARNE